MFVKARFERADANVDVIGRRAMSSSSLANRLRLSIKLALIEWHVKRMGFLLKMVGLFTERDITSDCHL